MPGFYVILFFIFRMLGASRSVDCRFGKSITDGNRRWHCTRFANAKTQWNGFIGNDEARYHGNDPRDSSESDSQSESGHSDDDDDEADDGDDDDDGGEEETEEEGERCGCRLVFHCFYCSSARYYWCGSAWNPDDIHSDSETSWSCLIFGNFNSWSGTGSCSGKCFWACLSPDRQSRATEQVETTPTVIPPVSFPRQSGDANVSDHAAEPVLPVIVETPANNSDRSVTQCSI